MLRFWHLVFLISPALVLTVPSGHFVGPFFMSLAGLWFWRRAAVQTPVIDHDLAISWTWLLGGFAALVISGVGLGVWHGNHAGHFEMYVPFVLFPAMAWLIRAGRWDSAHWFVSVAVGALLAFLFAVYQVFGQGIGRATGAVGNPIPFGNTAIVLAAVVLVACVLYPFGDPHSKWKRPLLLMGGVAGACASLLSGSKGGWISLFIIGVTVVYLATQGWPAWRRHLAAAAVVFLLIFAGLMAPSHVVKDRIISGLKGGWYWIQTGEVTESSVSMRFEIWKLSLQVISEKPFLGHGSLGAHARWNQLSKQAESSPELAKLFQAGTKFISADNELLGALKGGGLLGATGLLAAYVGVWLAFWRWRSHPDSLIKTLSAIGLLLVPLYLEFGLSVAVFGTNVFRSVFVALSVTLLAFISVRLHQLRNKK